MSKINKKRPIYVLDTNVLLYNPRAVYAFPDADVVIPDIVLGELDKVKTSRADRELRFRSREISRILFEFSEKGKLTDGIPFGKNSVVRVINFDPAKGTPDQFGTKNSDDRILSIVYQLKRESNGRPVTIVTNDLNMLLKAQTLDIKVEHPGEEFAYGKIKRAFFKLKTKKRQIWTTAGVAAIIAFVIMLKLYPSAFGIQPAQNIPSGPPELVQQFQDYQNKNNALQAQKETYESNLKKNPKDIDSLIGMGDTYSDMGDLSQDVNNYKKAVDYYKKVLEMEPNRSNVRTDMAIAYYNLGMADLAIGELNKVISTDKNFVQAYYNLGVILYQNKNDLQAAKEYFQKVVDMAPKSVFALRAQDSLNQIDAQLKAHPKTK